MRSRAWTLALFVAAASCDDGPIEAREAQIVSVMAAADEAHIRVRPALAAGKYARMAASLFDFYRGTVPIYRSDMRTGTTALATSRFALDVPLVPSLGDPHPENFGVLVASDGSLGLEPNDFDAADDAPYLWDVRRLAAGMALAVMESNAEDGAVDPDARTRALDARRPIVRSAVAGYLSGIQDAARGAPPGRVTAESEPSSAIVRDVFRRSARDLAERSELAELTILEDGQRRLKRGAPAEDDPQHVYAELLPAARAALPAAIERYRATLLRPPPLEHLRILDAVRELGSGVASWTRIRIILLVRGPTDDPSDDVVLELKELTDSLLAGLYPPGVYRDSVADRVLYGARGAWARADAEPWWGTTTLLGLPCQIRLESEGQKNVRVARMVDDEGTPEAIEALGWIIGRVVARTHGSGPDGAAHAQAIYKRIAEDPEGFLDEQTDTGISYAELVKVDHARWIRSLHRLGLRLGVPFDPLDAPSPDVAVLLGTPPPPSPLPPSP